MDNEARYLISIDGGGTKTGICVYDCAADAGKSCICGGGNYKTHGIETVKTRIDEGLRGLLPGIEEIPAAVRFLVMGISGVTFRTMEAISSASSRQSPCEMQMIWSPDYNQRALFNAAKAYSRELPIGGDYRSLKTVYSLNLLNERGKALRAAVQAITDEHKGMEGALSPRGGREHQQLAARMVARFPKVFRSKDRKEVSAVASTVQRCIVSMANFTGMLNQKAPGMDFSYTSGERFMELMHPPIAFPRGPVPGFGPRGEAQPAPSFDFSRFYGQIFNAPSKAMEAIPDAEGFVRSVFNTAILCQDLDFMDLDILRSYFTIDELMFLWPRMNNIIYLLWGNSLEHGEAVQAVV